jgi:uncharacterized protein
MVLARGCNDKTAAGTADRAANRYEPRADAQATSMPSNAPSIAGRRPMLFDALKLSASGESLAGTVDARDLPRVADRLTEEAGPAPIEWHLTGGSDGQRRPMLTLTLTGSVPLMCQRCLQPFSTPVDQLTELLLARSEAELTGLDADEVEVILATARLDALTLVEDELLLSLPFSPRHAEGECEAAIPAVSAQEKNEARVAPFGRLGELKKTR